MLHHIKGQVLEVKCLTSFVSPSSWNLRGGDLNFSFKLLSKALVLLITSPEHPFSQVDMVGKAKVLSLYTLLKRKGPCLWEPGPLTVGSQGLWRSLIRSKIRELGTVPGPSATKYMQTSPARSPPMGAPSTSVRTSLPLAKLCTCTRKTHAKIPGVIAKAGHWDTLSSFLKDQEGLEEAGLRHAA